MAINNAQPMAFSPIGLVDAFDASRRFPGACRKLTNLMFDQSNPELVIPRAPVGIMANLALVGFNNPTVVSVHTVVGTVIYGMVATSRNAGKDEPFAFDTATMTVVTISGVTSGNTPNSPPTTGDWKPPTMAVIGAMIVITHPGFTGSNGYYGVIDITTPASPAWRSENTTTNALSAVPVAVANFNNRAWFAVGNQLPFTDVLTNPLTITNASQVLTIGDTTPVVALSGLPIQTQNSGVVQGLSAFKASSVWQVTGDTATANLSLNFASLNIGTTFPRTVVSAQYGVYFISVSGPFMLDVFGNVRPVSNDFGGQDPDVRRPFQLALNASRWCAGYANNIYRACGATTINQVPFVGDYWFDESKRRWNGPHTFIYDCASQFGHDWILTGQGYPGLLMVGHPFNPPLVNYSPVEEGYPIELLSSTFPKIGDMFQKQVAESQIELGAFGGAIPYTITAQDEQGNILGNGSITVTATGPGILWGGGNTWGDGSVWSEAISIPHTYPVDWLDPLVFEKMQIDVLATATVGQAIGAFYARYQRTGYMTRG